MLRDILWLWLWDVLWLWLGDVLWLWFYLWWRSVILNRLLPWDILNILRLRLLNHLNPRRWRRVSDWSLNLFLGFLLLLFSLDGGNCIFSGNFFLFLFFLLDIGGTQESFKQ